MHQDTTGDEIGLLMARELGRRGCAVFICARSQEELMLAVERLAAQG
ncbi:MAG: hypothetical protein ACYCW6_28275 [Candidatus Xenobia bacterium]